MNFIELKIVGTKKILHKKLKQKNIIEYYDYDYFYNKMYGNITMIGWPEME